jgi:Icc-related predicted phosphoesterase
LKVLIISDLHYEKRMFHGIDESKAWNWLIQVVGYHRPDYLLSGGDWGPAVNVMEFYELLRRVTVLTIYGNHENMGVLTKLQNIQTNYNVSVLMEDGKVYELEGVKIAGINGIISKKRKTKKGVPRKKPDEFLEIAERLADKNIDMLLMHETPHLPKLFPFMQETLASRTASKAVELVKPSIVINGHMHYGGYNRYDFPFGTKYIYICSDQKHRHYLILNIDNERISRIEVWKDFEQVDKVSI